jgi:hypothetical protein
MTVQRSHPGFLWAGWELRQNLGHLSNPRRDIAADEVVWHVTYREVGNDLLLENSPRYFA